MRYADKFNAPSTQRSTLVTLENAMNFEKTDRNNVKRVPNRGHYDRETIFEILDAGFLCHAGFVVGDQPFVIPTLYGRIDDKIYLHGSAASRMLKNLADGIPVCLTVTHVDGLVLARSAFHHSMNYRSAVIFGNALPTSGAEKVDALFAISEQVLKGRWEETREPNEKELKATSVLRVEIESGSAKIRTGPPGDEAEDYELPIWAGVVPIVQDYQLPVPDPKLTGDIDVSPSVANLLGKR
jgi:nitroimidazol reductase NimA-like FMN-containing flavoprotein (pyridoxamine 5'-phosphate oxidase superfamily)